MAAAPEPRSRDGASCVTPTLLRCAKLSLSPQAGRASTPIPAKRSEYPDSASNVETQFLPPHSGEKSLP